MDVLKSVGRDQFPTRSHRAFAAHSSGLRIRAGFIRQSFRDEARCGCKRALPRQPYFPRILRLNFGGMQMLGARVRAGNVEGLPEVFASLGVDLAPLLKLAAITSEAFDDPESFIPLAAIDELLFQAEARSGCDHVGLLIGRRPADLGPPAYLFLNAPTLRAGIQDVIALIALVHTGGGFALQEISGVATVRYSTIASSLRCAHHTTDCALAQMFGALVRRCGPSFRASEVRLPRRAPADLSLYRAHYKGARLVFDAPEAAIDFPAEQLDQAAPTVDAKLYLFLKSRLARLANRDSEPLRDRATRILGTMISDPRLSLDFVAETVGLTRKELQRQLRSEGVSFGRLRSETRHVAAMQMIQHTTMPLGSIAVALRYADSSALSRSFLLRTGKTPSEWRKNRRTQAST
jgi:AraC-like DNA-binding protein